jgi:hypothetical protein
MTIPAALSLDLDRHPGSERSSRRWLGAKPASAGLRPMGGSFFEKLHHAPVRDDVKIDALAMQILDSN